MEMGRKDKEIKHASERDKYLREHKSKRRPHDKFDKDSGPSKRRRKDEDHMHIVDEDPDDDDMWIEKNIDMDGEAPLATDIPTAKSLELTSRAYTDAKDPALPPSEKTETSLKRDEWMLMLPTIPTIPEVAPRIGMEDEPLTEGYGEPGGSARMTGGNVDFFSSLGTERRKKPGPDRPDPDKLKIHAKELNTTLKEDGSLADIPTAAHKANVPGGPGSQWRMMKLQRVYERAEEEGKPVEEVALERFETLEAFEEAKEERRILDERTGKRASSAAGGKGKGRDTRGERGFMFNDVTASGAPSRSSSFRRPDVGDSVPATPTPGGQDAAKKYNNPRLNTLGTPGQTHTPIPSVMTPSASVPGLKRAISPSSLNRLQAKVLRAKLMGAENAEALETQYEQELRKAQGSDEDGVRTKVEVLPTLDARGRLYDVGTGKDDPPPAPGNRRKREYVETRNPKTGDLIRVNADDDQITLGELLRQEKFGAGMADQKNLDAEFARTIMTDGGFENDIDYMDDNAERLARKKMRSDAMKRQFAINDYKRTQKVLATCPYCYGEDDSPPKVPFVAMGTRVYLSCTHSEELTPGHCVIVPIQHHLTMLEADDDVWDEVRNFMKSLMRMYAEEDRGVVFYETVLSLKPQKHTFIECVPVPWEIFDQLPGYFKESILMSETEWSQHKKLIDFSARPGGFRRAMVSNLPYFMVQFDYKGEKGYGHVIEGTSDAAGDGDDPEGDIDEGEKGGGEFPRYFAGEIIGNLLDIEPRRWRHPRRIDFRQNRDRVRDFKQKFDKYDWTDMIGKA